MTMEEPRDPASPLPSPSQQRAPASADLPLAVPDPIAVSPAGVRRAWWARVNPGKVGLFFASLYLFVLAVTLMKEGAPGVAPLVRHLLSVTNMADSLGFGWLFAYPIMSGSPVATAALTFFNAGLVDQLGTFAMITGSRIGASFIILLIGFLHVLRGRDRAMGLSMGLLSLTVTATTYLPALLLGILLLKTGVLDNVQIRSGVLLHSLIGQTVDPVAGVVTSLLPEWAVFLVGLGVILLSLNLFEKCLPQMTLKESQVGWMSRLVYRPGVMFILGGLITLISMSVGLSLSLLVPLSIRGFVRRENVIPYIMGANITTFIDTLLAAVLLNNPPAFTVVLVEMFSVTVVSILILAVMYRRYLRAMLDLVTWVTASSRNLVLFMIPILIVPIVLLLT
jgi:sodium-dependent phosphate cotransporter